MKKLKLLLLLFSPLMIIRKGLESFEEDIHKKNCLKKYNIDQLPTIELTEVINNFPEKITPYSFLDGSSLITDLLLLKGLAKKYTDCSYLEIGSWRGESISNVASIAKECISVTLSAKEMKSMNFSEEFIKVHGFFSKKIENVKTIEANSHQFDFNSLNKKFDLIFIDGDHTYNGVSNDTKKTFNLRKGNDSIIVWHDYGFGIENVRHSVLEGILDGIPKEKHKNLYHVSNTLCAIYIENCKYETQKNASFVFPNKYFDVSTDFSKL